MSPPDTITTAPYTTNGDYRKFQLDVMFSNPLHEFGKFDASIIVVTDDNFEATDGYKFDPTRLSKGNCSDDGYLIKFNTCIYINNVTVEVIGLSVTPTSIHFNDLTPVTAEQQQTDSISIKNENSDPTTIISAK